MKESVNISVIQFASKLLERDKNIERMKFFIETEAKEGTEFVIFPELANIGYITPAMVGEPVGYRGMSNKEFASRYIRAAERIPGPTTEALSELTGKYGLFVAVGVAQLHPLITGTLYNSGVLIGPQGIIGIHHKMHIPLNEKQYFYPGNTSEVFRTELGNIGIEVCYDGRFPELTRILSLKGAEIICCLWAIPGGLSNANSIAPDVNGLKYRSYTRAQENGVYFISANRAGYSGETQFLGHSAIAAPNGTIIASSETVDEDTIRVRLTEEQLIEYRSTLSIFRDRRPEMYEQICKPLSEPYKQSTVITSKGESRLNSTSLGGKPV